MMLIGLHQLPLTAKTCEALNNFKQLETLKLDGWEKVDSHSLSSTLLQFHQLQKFSLELTTYVVNSDSDIDDSDEAEEELTNVISAKVIQSLVHCSHIELLGNFKNNRAIERAMKSLKNLQTLQITLLTSTGPFPLCASHPALTSLRCSSQHLSDSALQLLANRPFNPNTYY